jgi:hypothetical protein
MIYVPYLSALVIGIQSTIYKPTWQRQLKSLQAGDGHEDTGKRRKNSQTTTSTK